MLTPHDAKFFAIAAHKACKHKRKYSGECYTVHLKEVATMVENYGGTDEMIAAAWLHDIVEDTGITIEDIDIFFGADIGNLVGWLTDISMPEDGNRKTRKAIDRNHLSYAPASAQTIKLCDVISNTSSIMENDPKFAEVYLREKADLLAVMTEGHPEAYKVANSITALPTPN